MANPTAAASANKTGKPRKKTEMAHCHQANPAQANPVQASTVQASSAKIGLAQPTSQGECKGELEQGSELGMAQKSGQTRKTTTKSSSNDLGRKPGHKEAMVSKMSGRKTAASSASKPKAASALGPVSDQTPAFNNQKDTLVLTNCTSSPRGIAFKNGIVILQPREMRLVPAEQQEEVRDLFKNPTFQRFVDHGIFRLSRIGDDEQSVEVKTPAPPEILNQEICLNELQMSIGTSTGSRATSPKVVAYQQGGALPETNNNTGVVPEIN